MDEQEQNREKNRASGGGRAPFYILLAVVCLTAALAVAAIVLGAAALAKDFGGKTIIEHHYDNELYEGVVETYKYNAVELKVGSSTYGSAFVYTFDGDGSMYLITNYHVVKSAPALVSARFYGKNVFYETGHMTVAGYNAQYDVAVLKTALYPQNQYIDIKKDGKLIAAAAQGVNILCLGNNLGYGIQAQSGIVSRDSLVRTVDTATADRRVLAVVPVCAPLNSGNSGAPVFDLNGGLIGMNTWQVTKTASDRPVNDMCYLVPATVIDAVFENVLKFDPAGGESDMPIISLSEGDYGTLYIADLKARLAFDDFRLTVTSVDALGTRSLKEGDVILSFGSVTVTPCNFPSVIGELWHHSAAGSGDTLKVKIVRGGAEMQVALEELKRL